jgi:hypothetical protein
MKALFIILKCAETSRGSLIDNWLNKLHYIHRAGARYSQSSPHTHRGNTSWVGVRWNPILGLHQEPSFLLQLGGEAFAGALALFLS